MRINPKLAHRLGGTDCIFYHTRNSWRVYPQKIERKQDERQRDGWVAFWVSAWSFSPTLFRFVFSRIYKRVLCIICVQWRVFFLGSSERTYGAVKEDRKRVTLCICNPTLCSPPLEYRHSIWVQRKNYLKGNTAWTNPNTTFTSTNKLRKKMDNICNRSKKQNKTTTRGVTPNADKVNSQQTKCGLHEKKYQIILIAQLLFRNC